MTSFAVLNEENYHPCFFFRHVCPRTKSMLTSQILEQDWGHLFLKPSFLYLISPFWEKPTVKHEEKVGYAYCQPFTILHFDVSYKINCNFVIFGNTTIKFQKHIFEIVYFWFMKKKWKIDFLNLLHENPSFSMLYFQIVKWKLSSCFIIAVSVHVCGHRSHTYSYINL